MYHPLEAPAGIKSNFMGGGNLGMKESPLFSWVHRGLRAAPAETQIRPPDQWSHLSENRLPTWHSASTQEDAGSLLSDGETEEYWGEGEFFCPREN